MSGRCNASVDLGTFARTQSSALGRRLAILGFFIVTATSSWVFVTTFKGRVESSVLGAASDMSNLLALGDSIQIQRQTSSLVRNSIFSAATVVALPNGLIVAESRDSALINHDVKNVKDGLNVIGRNVYFVVRREIQTSLGATRGLFIALTPLPIRDLAFFWLVLGAVFAAFALVFKYGYFRIGHEFASAIITVDEAIANSDPAHPEKSLSTLPVRFTEVRRIIDRFQRLIGSVSEYERRVSEAAKVDALVKLAQQVSHDIRSPLAALSVITSELNDLPEDSRLLIRSAVNRINDISNDLLRKTRSQTQPNHDSLTNEADSRPELLCSLLDGLISEKRLQLRSKLGVEIEFQPDERSYGLFASVRGNELKRVVSNLINNAVESLEDKGVVAVELLGAGDHIEVRVRDSGKGIPSDILSRLGQRGETHGKKGGTGLGLYHARTTVETWGGSLEIQSVLKVGTTVILRLPKAPAPPWFVSGLSIGHGAAVVIMDDDMSIHQIWDGRLNSARVADIGVKVFHFSTAQDFRRWVKTRDGNDPSVYLVDYELLGESTNGLKLVEELGICPEAILVTSRYEEHEVRVACERLGVCMIPKGMAGFVPISVGCRVEKKKPDAVLLDDDPLVHLAWQTTADRSKKVLNAFDNAETLLSKLHEFDPKTMIFVDSNLGNGVIGEEVAEKIFHAGFENIFLATGYPSESRQAPPWIKAVVGKGPPWANLR